MDIISAPDLGATEFTTYRLGGTLGEFLGNLYAGCKLFVYADRFGVGKSFMATAIAHAWALDHEGSGRKALYCSPEEGVGVTSRDRVRQLGADAPALLFSDFTTMDALKKAIRDHRIGLVVLDSISKVDPHSQLGEAFLEWCTKAGVTVLYVAQAVKGGAFRGSNRVPHEVDVVIRVTRNADNKGSTAFLEKNRRGPNLYEIPVPFTPKALRALLGKGASPSDRAGTEGWKPPRQNASKLPPIETHRGAYERGRLARRQGLDIDETDNSPYHEGSILDREFVDGWMVEDAELRENPVPVPFTITVGELTERHSIRSASRLNKLVGWESPCVIELLGDTERIPKGDTERAMQERAALAKFGFAYKTRSRVPKGGSKDDRRRVRVLTVKVWGEATDEDLFERSACEPTRRPADVYEYAGEDFQECLAAFVRAFRGIRLVIRDQAHAKTVLGAREYRRQEKEQARAADAPEAKKPARAAKPKRAKRSKKAAVKPEPAPAPTPKPEPKPKKKRGKKAVAAKPRPAEPSGDGAAAPAELAEADAGMDRIEALLRAAIKRQASQ